MNTPAVIVNPETRFNRSSWLLLLVALLFLSLNLAQIAYRFTLPTEGWSVSDDDNGEERDVFFVRANLVGAVSPLQPGDALRVIGGIPAAQILNNDSLSTSPPPGWVVGGQVPVELIRNGQTLTFDIPIVDWTFAAWLKSNFTDLKSIVIWLSALVMLGVGLLTFLKRPANLAGRFLFLFGVAVFNGALAGSLPDGLGINFDFMAVFGKLFFANIYFAYMFGPSLLGFSLTFPHPKSFIQRHSWLLVLPFLLGSSTVVLLLIAPPWAVIGFAFTLGMILLAIGALIHSALTVRDTVSRAQLRWAVGGAMMGMGLFTLNFVIFDEPGLLRNVRMVLAYSGLPVMGVSLAVAILRYRLFDIDVIISRTLLYATLSALLGVVYFGGVTLLQSLFVAISGQQSPAAVVISTLMIAALFNPLRYRLQDMIDRRFYRRKYNAEKALAEFAAAARSETDLDRLAARLGTTVSETLQPEQVSLWMKT